MARLLQAVRSNDKREALVSLRDQIAATIDSCESGRDMASLSKRLMEVIEEIDAIDAERGAKLNPLQAARAKNAAR